MTIPRGIKREHVITAINEVMNNGFPKDRKSTKYDLVYDGRRYPPKYVIGLANKYANGYGLTPQEHFGGGETNKALENLGFEIREKSYGEYELLPDELNVDENNVYIEGAIKRIYVNAYERNSAVRKICLKHHGYNCTVCEFNFEAVYGEIGERFIHVHHLKPLHELKKEYKVDPVNDLQPVCPNCHAMLHKKEPAYTIEELRTILNQKY